MPSLKLQELDGSLLILYGTTARKTPPKWNLSLTGFALTVNHNPTPVTRWAFGAAVRQTVRGRGEKAETLTPHVTTRGRMTERLSQTPDRLPSAVVG